MATLSQMGVQSSSDAQTPTQFINIATVVKEILQYILTRPKKSRFSLNVSIKSTKSNNTSSTSWFYIKVITSTKLDKDAFINLTASSAPHLFEFLRHMHDIEDESHLCVQCPVPGSNLDPSAVGSVQQNLVLEGDTLRVVQETTKSKPCTTTTLYLRVHQHLGLLITQCKEIRNYMKQIKIFKPQCCMWFSVKIGEVVSEDDFSVDCWRRSSSHIPDIVTDPHYFLHESGLQPLSSHLTTHYSEPTLVSIAASGVDRGRMVQMTSVGHYIPVTGQSQSVGVVTLTIFGPNNLPLDSRYIPDNCTLDNIGWDKYDLNVLHEHNTQGKGVLPHHSMVSVQFSTSGATVESFVIPVYLLLHTVDGQDRDYNTQCGTIASVLTQHQYKWMVCVDTVLDKLLQPILANMKTRKTVSKCIKCVCKAIKDIVSLSADEDFRSNILTSMKVHDSVELKTKLSHKLTVISRARHHGIWRGENSTQHSENTSTYSQEKPPLPVIVQQASQHIHSQAGTTYEHLTEIHRIGEDVERPINDKIESPFHQLMDSAVDDEEPVNHLQRSRTNAIELNQMVNTKYQFGDKQILDESNTDDEKPFERFSSQNRTAIVDFGAAANNYAASVDAGLRKGETYIDRTPEITYITDAMKEVSPFQQLADTDHPEHQGHIEASNEDPCGDRGQYRDCGKPFIPVKLGHISDRYATKHNTFESLIKSPDNKKLCTDTHKQTIQGSLFPTQSYTSHWLPNEQTELSTTGSMLPRHYSNTTDGHTQKTAKDIERSDFDLLNSRDWQETFNVVSDFVDHIVDGTGDHQNTAADLKLSKVLNIGTDVGMGNVSSVKEDKTSKSKCDETRQDDSDDWFNDVLVDVENWLN